jgi:hypothetical protein
MPPKPLWIAFIGGLPVILFLFTHAPEIVWRGAAESDLWRGIMRIIVSLILLGGALWVIIARKYSPADRHWAYGIVGTIAGFWMNS